MRRKLFLPLMAVFAVFALGVWFFGAEPETFSTRLRESICAGSERIALASATDFDWDAAVILTPGSDPRLAERALGVPFADYLVQADAENDALIFVRDRKIVRVVKHARKDGDFAPAAAGRRLTREQAIFAIATGRSCDKAELRLLE